MNLERMYLPLGITYQERKIQTGENFCQMQDEVSRNIMGQCIIAKQQEQSSGVSAEGGDIQEPERLHGHVGVGVDLERE